MYLHFKKSLTFYAEKYIFIMYLLPILLLAIPKNGQRKY